MDHLLGFSNSGLIVCEMVDNEKKNIVKCPWKTTTNIAFSVSVYYTIFHLPPAPLPLNPHRPPPLSDLLLTCSPPHSVLLLASSPPLSDLLLTSLSSPPCLLTSLYSDLLLLTSSFFLTSSPSSQLSLLNFFIYIHVFSESPIHSRSW